MQERGFDAYLAFVAYEGLDQREVVLVQNGLAGFEQCVERNIASFESRVYFVGFDILK